MNRGPDVPSPPGYGVGYAQSYGLAFDALIITNLIEVCRHSGASLISDLSLRLDVLGSPVTVDIGQRTIESHARSLPTTDKLIILHYLVTAGGQPPAGKLISFKDIPDGAGYFPTFYKRAIAPVVNKFGESPRRLPIAAADLGGVMTVMGDAAVSFKVFPHVTLNWILWQGDEALKPEGSVLFDSSITNYLPVEDIVALCHSIAIRLCA
jgi:hypothetical protein